MRDDSPLRGVKDRVIRIPAYTLRAIEAPVKLNQNENPHDFPEDLKEEVFRRLRARRWSRYPEFVPDSLRERLAAHAGWRPDGLLVGNGSNELLLATLMVLVSEGTPVAAPSPTFTVYGLIGGILGAEWSPVPLRRDMSYDAEALLGRAVELDAGLIIVCSPNNPTGSVLPRRGLELILERFRGHVLVDEAYFEFCGETAVGLLESHPRLIVTRTFSKAMGMAGLRVGYLLAHPDLTAQISKAKLPYNINQFSLTAADVALEHIGRFRPAIESILSERDRLGRELAAIPGIRVFPSRANFFLFELPVEPRAAFEALLARGVLIRDVSSYPMLSRCLRVTVGTPGENDRFLAALRELLSGGGP